MRLVSRTGVLALVFTAAAACEQGPQPETPRTPAASHGQTQTDLPWPVPLPSTSMEIPAALRAPAEPGSHLTRASDWLARALVEAGYSDFRWYDIPKGFALVTRLELIDDQGQAMAHPDPAVRFSVEYPPLGFFTMRFWAELLHGRTGRFRALVFVVIDHPFGYAKDVTDAQIVWMHPSRELPLNRADLAYTAEDNWYALVYEVERADLHDNVHLVERPSDPSAHLNKSGILAALDHVSKTDASRPLPR